MPPEATLARALLAAFRPDFEGREATAAHLAGLVLDAVDAVLPLEGHAPAEGPLARLEELASSADVYGYEGAPGWDVVLARGLLERPRLVPGPSLLDGLGDGDGRDRQRGELKRRVRALGRELIALGRSAASAPTAGTVVSLHATLVRLCGAAAISSALLLPEEERSPPLPEPADLVAEIDARAGGFALAQEEWLARLLEGNPAARVPEFRRLFAGLSQTLRTAEALRRLRDDAQAADFEALLGALGGWQPIRWASLRAGAPVEWIARLFPAVPAEPGGATAEARLSRECQAALDTLGRAWNARELTPAGFATLYAAFVARVASVSALCEELL